MTTDTELAKKLFKRSLGSGSSALSNTGGEGSQPTELRYGTIVGIGEDGITATVELDITGVHVDADTDGVEYRVGDRVTLIWQGNRWVIISNEAQSKNLKDAQEELAEQITQEGDAIRESVKKDLGEVDDAFNRFKEDHRLTDADIAKQIEEDGRGWYTTISGEINTALESYVTTTALDVTVDGLKSTVSETYQSKTDAGTMEKSLASRIEQVSSMIETEVSDRKQAVSGAEQTLSSKITQLSNSITQTVSDEVKTATGNISQRLTTVETTASGLKTTVSEHASTIGNIDSWMTFSTSGLAIGSSATSYTTNTTSTGFYIKYGTTNLAGITANYSMFHAGIAATTAYYGVMATNTGMSASYESIVAGKILYSNASGTTGSISIADSFLNYRFLEFVYGDDKDRMATKRIHIKQTKDRTVTLDRTIHATDGTMFTDVSTYTIASSTLTKNTSYSGRSIIGSSNASSTDSNSTIIVYYVIGWR